MSITYEELSRHPIMARPAILYAAFAEILPRQPELFTGEPVIPASRIDLIQQGEGHLIEHGGDIALQLLEALGQLAVAQEQYVTACGERKAFKDALRALVEAADRPLAGNKQFGNALTAARKLLEAK